jgi:ribosomal protein S18 acetylase RimI-like enzyme
MDIALLPASEDDFEELVRIRISAMKESLEKIGRFDEARARARFRQGFSPRHTRHVLVGNQRVGFVVSKLMENEILLDHLYIEPKFQRQGIGAEVLKQIFTEADLTRLPVKVGALKESQSNEFYIRHGFELIGQGEWDLYYVRSCKVQNG